MAEDNNKKSSGEKNQAAKTILKEENVKVEKKVVKETKDKEGNVSTKTETVTTTFRTAAGACVDLFNTIADEVNRKAQKEMNKPRYRFLENRQAYMICDRKDKSCAVIVNNKTKEPIWIDKNFNIISGLSSGESFKDIVDLRYQKKENDKEDNLSTESAEFLLENYDNLVLVPVFTTDHYRIYEKIDELKEQLNSYKYRVDVCENLDCKDVTKDSRYYVRISKENGIYMNFDLLKYEDNIKDFAFDEVEFIENMICRIEGSNSVTTKNIANCIADYLAHIMYFREFYTLQYSTIGWDYYDWDKSGWIFKYDKIISKIGLLNGEAREKCAEGLECKKGLLDIERLILRSTDRDSIVEVTNNIDVDEELDKDKKAAQIKEQYGDEFEWVAFTRRLINEHPYDALILGAGISGLIRQLLPYTKENNININIVGKPGSGKSTICHYLLGMFGNPEKLEGSFTDSANSMEQIRVQRPVLPYVLDERMLRVEGESEKTKQHTILMDIFREYEGKVKERLGKQYEETSGERTYGPIISSSVKSMMDYIFSTDDLGQYRRFIEFDIGDKMDHILFEDAAEAKRAESIAYKNYGYGIRIIVDYILELLNDCDKDASVICEMFHALDQEIESKLKERQDNENDEKVYGLSDSSKRFALIVLSYQILRDALNYYDEKMLMLSGNILDNDIIQQVRKIQEDKTEKIIDLLIDNLVLKMKKVKHKANYEEENRIYNYILENEKYFYKFSTQYPKDAAKELYNNKDKYLGFIKKNKENEIELYTIMLYQLDQFWYMNRIPEPETILRYVKEVDEQKISSNEEAINYGKEKYGTNSDHAQKYFKEPGKKEIAGRTNYEIPSSNKKTVDFHKKIVRYVKPVEEKAGDSK